MATENVAHASVARRPATEPIAPTKFAHFVLKCANIDESKKWYRAVLNAEVRHENDFLCFMSFDEEHHRLALVNTPDAKPRDPEAAGLEHVAYTMGSLGDLMSTYRRLKGEGIVPYWCINHGITTSMYFRDPEGNQVELQVDNFNSAQEAIDYIEGPDFAANPLGIEFDPDLLADKYFAGEPVAELVKMGSAPVQK